MNLSAAEHFRTKVRQILEEKHISQDQLAQNAGLHRVSLNRILQGHTIPNIDTCAAIASAIDEPLSDLLPQPAKILSPSA